MSEKVFIDLDEEIIFIVEKIKKAEGKRIIVIVPERAALLGSIVSLKLLFSEIIKSDKDVILVTKDEIGLKLAKKANIVALEKVNQIDDSAWDKAKNLREKVLKKEKAAKERLISERKESKAPEAEKAKTSDAGKKDLHKIEAQKVDIGGFEMFAGGDIAEMEGEEEQDEQSEEFEEVDAESLIGEKSSRLRGSKVKTGGVVGRDISKYSYTSRLARDGKRRQGVDRQGPGIGEKLSELVTNVKAFLTKGGQQQKIIIGGIVVIVIFFLLSYFVFPKGTVKIFIESQDIEIEEQIVADTAVSTLDVENLTIPAKLISVTDDRSEGADSTGEKETGENAKGQITIYNKTESEVTIAEGTVVEAIRTGQRYKILSSGTVPARKPDDDPESPGAYGVWDDVGIVAESFGEDFNIANEKMDFRIQGYDVENIYGKNFTDVTGGTTEKQTIVSQEDYDKLKKELEDDLKENLDPMLISEAGTNREVLEDTIKYEVINESSSPAVDAEADSFTLNITVKATALSFAKDDIDRLAESLADKSGSDVEIEEFEYSSKVLKTEGNQIHINLNITGIVTPSIDREEVKTNLVGKSQSAANEYLGELENIKSYEVDLSPPWLPSFLRHFPSSTGRIDVDIEKV